MLRDPKLGRIDTDDSVFYTGGDERLQWGRVRTAAPDAAGRARSFPAAPGGSREARASATTEVRSQGMSSYKRATTLSLPLAVPLLLAVSTVATSGVAVPTHLVAMPSPALVLARTTTAAQDPSVIEASLNLDRPTRRLIQQGLQNEGFDPGAPDGLFGPRTRAAIRAWQLARGRPASGYLSAQQAALLRAAAVSGEPPPPAPSAAAVPAANCDEWNTQGFFETVTPVEVAACLASGANVAARTDDGHTPLHMAANLNSNPAALQPLLNAGADLLARIDGDGHTPLHDAAVNSNPAVLQVLLDAAGADDVETRTTDGLTLLHWAASRNDNPTVLEALLAAGADREARTNDGRTPLHLAARNANPAVLQVLLAAGVNMEAQDESGNTPLHYAVSRGDPTVINALLATGVDVDARNAEGVTPLLHLFGALSSIDDPGAVLGLLLSAGADPHLRDESGRTALHAASLADDDDWLSLIPILLAAGADPRVANERGTTALHLVALRRSNNRATVEALLAAGADATAQDERGRTALHSAARYANDPAIIDALVAAGADLAARETYPLGDGRSVVLGTPLFSAALNQSLAVVEALLQAGSDVADARIHNGLTVLHQAAQFNDNPAVIELLLAAGADVNARDSWGKTPLHRTAEGYNNAFMINVLANAGANLDVRDDEGNTPLHLAATRGVGHEAIDALLTAGAHPTMRDSDGRTPWDIARENYELRGTDAYWRLNEARLNVLRDHGDTELSATRVEVPSSTLAELEPDDTDYFRIDVTSSSTLTVETQGAVDTIGRLTGNGVDSEDDDDGDGTNFLIRESVSPGTYYVRVRGLNSSRSGGYRLLVRVN